MISTYAELKDAVRKWLLRDNSDLVVTTSQIENYISLAEAELNRVLKITDLEDSTTLTTVTGQNYVNLPAGFRGVQAIAFTAQPTGLMFLPTLEQLIAKFGYDQKRPQGYRIGNGKIIFNCPADAAHTISLDYYVSITALSDTNTSNAILTKFPDVYLYGSLKHALLQISDKEKLMDAASLFQGITSDIINADIAAKIPARAQMRPQRVL